MRGGSADEGGYGADAAMGMGMGMGMVGDEDDGFGEEGDEEAFSGGAGEGLPLQHTLVAGLDLDPSGLMAMRDSFFPPARATQQPAHLPSGARGEVGAGWWADFGGRCGGG